MNFAMLGEYWPSIWAGAQLTVLLAVTVLAIAAPLALGVALVRYLHVPVLAPSLAAYVLLFRAIPGLVVLFFSFYGLPRFGVALQPLPAAIVGMVLTSTAYISEDFRAGLQAIGRGQWDAANALGLSRPWIIRRIVLPQALPIVVPPFMTNAIITVKATAVASLVGVQELTGASMSAMSITYSATDFLLLAAGIYLALSGVLVLAQVAAEHRLSRHLRLPQAPTKQLA